MPPFCFSRQIQSNYISALLYTHLLCISLIQSLDVSIVYEIYDELDSPSVEYPPIPPKPSIGSTSQSGSIGSYSSVTSDGKVCASELRVLNYEYFAEGVYYVNVKEVCVVCDTYEQKGQEEQNTHTHTHIL